MRRRQRQAHTPSGKNAPSKIFGANGSQVHVTRVLETSEASAVPVTPVVVPEPVNEPRQETKVVPQLKFTKKKDVLPNAVRELGNK